MKSEAARLAVLALAALATVGLGACGSGASAPAGFVAAPRAATSARAPADFVGIVDPELLADVAARDPAATKATVQRLRAAHIGLVRQVFSWASIERRRGHYDFSVIDRFVAATVRAHVRILPVLIDPPAFAAAQPDPPRCGELISTSPPRRPAEMARFAAALVRRYGPAGAFWTAHPRLRASPIGAWQVWNEPNLKPFWACHPDPVAYTRLLRLVHDAIKRADPDAEVVAAGMPYLHFSRFLAGMYRAGGRSAFDTLAVHPYARDGAGVIAALELARALLRAHHDDRKPIWATEFGWASGGPASPYTVGEIGQARRVATTLDALASRRRGLGLRGFAYYDLRDLPRERGAPDFFGYHEGLVSRAGAPKPGYAAFARAAR